jgi:hypothetical protein
LQSARDFLRPESADAYAIMVPNLRWYRDKERD